MQPAPGARLTVRRPRHENAVNFLISEIERRPGEVTILEIGPMTNLALALRMRPEIETKIKRLVFMGGNVRFRATPRRWPNSISGSIPKPRASCCARAFRKR